jgi:hypothetical protein
MPDIRRVCNMQIITDIYLLLFINHCICLFVQCSLFLCILRIRKAVYIKSSYKDFNNNIVLVKWYIKYNLVCGFPPFWKISPQAFRFVSHQFYFFERPAEEVAIYIYIYIIVVFIIPVLESNNPWNNLLTQDKMQIGPQDKIYQIHKAKWFKYLNLSLHRYLSHFNSLSVNDNCVECEVQVECESQIIYAVNCRVRAP